MPKEKVPRVLSIWRMTLFWGVILQTCGLHTERPSTFELVIHLYYNATGWFKQTCRFILYYELVSTVNQPVLTAQVHCDHQDCKNRNKQMIPELGQLLWLVTKCLSGCCRRKSLIFFQLTHSQFQRLEQFFLTQYKLGQHASWEPFSVITIHDDL